jgi:hypothetical protein
MVGSFLLDTPLLLLPYIKLMTWLLTFTKNLCTICLLEQLMSLFLCRLYPLYVGGLQISLSI